jgi:hypothetical protein
MRLRIFNLTIVLGLFLFCHSVFAQGVTGPMIGRVTNASGNGIANTQISVSSAGFCFGWNGASTITNPFGYYSVDVHWDCFLIVVPSKKNYLFTPNIRFVNLYDGEEINFTGEPN